MDFIEQLFGLAPDGGDETFEFLLFAAPIALAVAVTVWRCLAGAAADTTNARVRRRSTKG